MRFETISNRNFGDPKVGTRTTRTWLFERRCPAGRCRLIARREFSDRYRTLPVTRRGGLYTARYKTRAQCRSGSGTFAYSERITFTISSSELVGGRRLASKLSGRSLAEGCQKKAARAVDRLRGERVDLPEAPGPPSPLTRKSLSVSAGTSTAMFSDASDDVGEIQEWAWDFGDPASGAANTATTSDPSHIYSQAGTYRVTLTVTDDEGLTASNNVIVTVDP